MAEMYCSAKFKCGNDLDAALTAAMNCEENAGKAEEARVAAEAARNQAESVIANHSHTAADVGAAPAGYGLGEGSGTWITDGNEANIGGNFYWGNSNTNLPFTYGAMRVDMRNGGSFVQTAYSEAYEGCVAQRKCTDGTFGAWEWVNPPMQLGVEYRTTERFLDKPVYVKAVSTGALPSGGSANIVSVATGIPTNTLDKLVRWSGSAPAVDGSIPILPDYTGYKIKTYMSGYVYVRNSAIVVHLEAIEGVDFSSVTGTIVLAYTKTTD